MFNKKGQAGLWTGITILVIIATIVIGIVFGLLTDQAKSSTISDDQFTAISNSCVRVTDNCIDSITQVKNITGAPVLTSANYSLCTDRAPQGRYDGIYFKGLAGYNGALLNTTYTEISCQKMSGFSTTITSYIPVLLALVLLVAVAGYVGMKKN